MPLSFLSLSHDLLQLCKNMDAMVFHDLVSDLTDRMDPKRAEDMELR